MSYNNKIEARLIWNRATNINENGLVEARVKRISNKMVIPIDFDFTQREYLIRFTTFGDMFAKIGGLRAAIMPIINLFMPFLILYFLVSLAEIVRDHTADRSKEACENLIKQCQNQFKKVLAYSFKNPSIMP